jgi:hypothetical protein
MASSFTVVLYEYETWSFNPREEQRLKVFKNKSAEENIWT